MATRLPRIVHKSRSDSKSSRSSPRRISPDDLISRITDIAVRVLPDPDSPIRPTRSPGAMENATSCTTSLTHNDLTCNTVILVVPLVS